MESYKDKLLKLVGDSKGRHIVEADFAGKSDEQAMREHVVDVIMDMKRRGDWAGVKVSVAVASDAVAHEACAYFGDSELFPEFKQIAVELFRECLN
jgi:hypothetical protein